MTNTISSASKHISHDSLLKHISTLASDEFQGRLPASDGEAITMKYFEDHFAELNKTSGTNFETYQQKVPAVEISYKSSMNFKVKGETIEVRTPEQFVASTRKMQPKVKLEHSQLVFAGYGITASEYDWDDFKGADVSNKTLLVLAGDPILPQPGSPDKVDDTIFRGTDLTYYGRWTYKVERAGALNAAAVLIIHETDRAGYGWDVVGKSFGRDEFVLKSINPDDYPAVEGWLSFEQASELLKLTGHNLADLKAASQRRDFKPIPLEIEANATIESTFRDVETNNFIAVLPGTDEKLKNESIIYSAHWDHFGVCDEGVLSGAVDNASGVAGVLCMASAFAHLDKRPTRSVVFFLPTMEEQNLLGSKFYVERPILPVSDTLAILNLEMLSPWGKSKAINNLTMGHSSLDEYFDRAAHRRDKTIVPEPQREKGYIYRSDHMPFMQAGVPALVLFFPCIDDLEKRQKFIANDYHKVSDKPKPDWDLSGAAEDATMFFEIGCEILNDGHRAKWNELSEFRRQ